MAEREGLDAPLGSWREQREEIRDVVIERGFDEEYDSFTQTFDGDRIDATGLLIPQTGFLPIDDERVQGTIEAVREHLTTPDGFVYRYQEGGDQMPGKEGAFILCSFWLVSALAQSGEVERAEEIFENVLETTSSVELFSEQVDVEREELLGNYPQAFSHIGLINSALYIAEAKRDDFSVESMGMNGTQQGSRTGDDWTGEHRTAETE
ncbi:glycoside hydrolase family 15 protein [Haladaptatus sp. R4]|uniref:glycoside hydrolase family 15 protein n=1 Tax=Haladaptatus sp. R4 TaxID=1679489 RepID=UPI0021009F99|nr:glycoside hydrolase family 15 protein [Haladaptatus sp. R4]